jgi:hypothetical protein
LLDDFRSRLLANRILKAVDLLQTSRSRPSSGIFRRWRRAARAAGSRNRRIAALEASLTVIVVMSIPAAAVAEDAIFGPKR